jgi:hypothetical protein
MNELDKYKPLIDRFLSGTLPGMNHARHVAIANVVMRLPYGRELIHLGLQITAIRAGVPEKYSRDITERYLAELDGRLPPLESFADVLG